MPLVCLEKVFIPSHTQWFAAFLMTGCVECGAIILGVSMAHDWRRNFKNFYKINLFYFFSIEIKFEKSAVSHGQSATVSSPVAHISVLLTENFS